MLINIMTVYMLCYVGKINALLLLNALLYSFMFQPSTLIIARSVHTSERASFTFSSFIIVLSLQISTILSTRIIDLHV